MASFRNFRENHPRRVPSAPDGTDRPPRLLLRFAVYTGVVLIATGVAIVWRVDRDIAARAEGTVESQGRAVAEANLRSHLRAADFVRPVTGARRAALDELFRERVLIPGVSGARLVSRDGTITYAARHELIGKSVLTTSDLAQVLSGRSTRRVTTGYDWRSQKRHKVLRALIPVRLARSARPLGLLELDQDYRAVDVQIADARGRLVMILALAFLALYASLFPILRRVTGQLRSTNRSLREQARERERLLEGERAARAEAETAQRLLTEQNERLRELDRLKDEFVSLVSHELRTPLTSIRGYLELLLEGEGGPLTPEQQRFLGIVDRNSRRLLGLVGDLLFLAQIDAGKLTIELEPVSLADVVDECVESAQAVAEARELELAASTDDVPELLGDGARLAQVLDNLISNALKFTPSGGRVEVRLQTVGREAVLEVEDNGLGIAGTEQPRLFDRFFRSSVATERAIPGSGLGLAIAKAIVERHHGAITLESAEEVGTTVRVTLPLPAPQPADAAPHEILV